MGTNNQNCRHYTSIHNSLASTNFSYVYKYTYLIACFGEYAPFEYANNISVYTGYMKINHDVEKYVTK